MTLVRPRASSRALVLIFLSAALAACGGGGGGGSATPVPPATPVAPVVRATFLLGGTVSGMSDGSTLTVTSGSDSVAVNANGTFTFPTRLASGATYTIKSSTPAGHVCNIADATGTIGTADVSKVVVTCTPFVLAGKPLLLNRAAALANDAAGATYVLDTAEQVIVRIGRDGATSVFAGTRNVRGHQDGAPGVGSMYTSDVSRLAFDPQGNLLVTDTCNGLIRKITPAGVMTTVAGKLQQACSLLYNAPFNVAAFDGAGANAVFSTPSAIAVSPAGSIVVASKTGGGIRRISAAGVVTTENPFTGATNYLVDAMAFNASGQLLLAGSGNGGRYLWRVDAASAVVIAGGTAAADPFFADTAALGTGFGTIRAIAPDAAGNIYIADNFAIRKLSGGRISTLAGSSSRSTDGTGATAFFNSIAGISLGTDGNLNVLQSGTTPLRIVTPAAVVTTVAATAPEYADGKGAAARFSRADYLASGPDGTIYALDGGRSVIRAIAPDGTVRRFAGVEGVTGAVDGPVATATMRTPISLAVDKAGTLFFIDRSGLRKIMNGVVSTIKADPELLFQGIYMRVLPDGRFILSGSDDVRVLSASGELVKVVDGNEVERILGLHAGISALATNGMEVDSAGNAYLSDPARGMIFKYSAAGNLTQFAGTLTINGRSDGGLSSGTLSFETFGDMAIDAAGNLYISGQGPIRKISPSGVLSTPALAWGNPNVYGITVSNGMLYGFAAGAVMQTPLP